MKQRKSIWVVLAILCIALTACTQAAPSEEEPALPYENITFQEGQLYAAAYLGWEEMADLDFYRETYLRGADVPIHYISPGEFYLIIPRYPDMAVKLYQNDINFPPRRCFCLRRKIVSPLWCSATSATSSPT